MQLFSIGLITVRVLILAYHSKLIRMMRLKALHVHGQGLSIVRLVEGTLNEDQS